MFTFDLIMYLISAEYWTADSRWVAFRARHWPRQARPSPAGKLIRHASQPGKAATRKARQTCQSASGAQHVPAPAQSHRRSGGHRRRASPYYWLDRSDQSLRRCMTPLDDLGMLAACLGRFPIIKVFFPLFDRGAAHFVFLFYCCDFIFFFFFFFYHLTFLAAFFLLVSFFYSSFSILRISFFLSSSLGTRCS